MSTDSSFKGWNQRGRGWGRLLAKNLLSCLNTNSSAFFRYWTGAFAKAKFVQFQMVEFLEAGES